MNKSARIIILPVLSAVLLTACVVRMTADMTETETLVEQDGANYDGLVDNPQSMDKKNQYDTLNVATYIMKADNTYFVADCYHNQIIYSDSLTRPLAEWKVLTDAVHYAHTIASDGTMFLVDDTENNRILAFQKTDAGYMHTQTLEGIGMKPHFIQYYEKKQVFMAWSSITGEMYFIKKQVTPNKQGVYPLSIEKVLKIDMLYGVYVRSFTILDDELYFVSGHNNQTIIKARIVENEEKTDFAIIARYDVPANLAGMVQLYKIQDYYYITVSTDNAENQDCATIIRTKSLETLMTGDYEDVYALFGLSGGTPYYINEIEGRYYMTHHRTNENIISFEVNDNVIENVAVIY